ncbi:hypothetical protein V8C42DRAFT_318582 [Trichoderma barbatum]
MKYTLVSNDIWCSIPFLLYMQVVNQLFVLRSPAYFACRFIRGFIALVQVWALEGPVWYLHLLIKPLCRQCLHYVKVTSSRASRRQFVIRRCL